MNSQPIRLLPFQFPELSLLRRRRFPSPTRFLLIAGKQPCIWSLCYASTKVRST
jgi:hypothetical protein